jgi:hypothetical protein
MDAKYESWVGSEVFTAAIMKTSIFWDITPCSPLNVNPMFRSKISPQCLVPKNKPSKKKNSVKQVASRVLLHAAFFAWLILRHWRWRRHIPLKRRLTFNRLHGITAQKIEFFYWNCSHLPPARITVLKNIAVGKTEDFLQNGNRGNHDGG